MVPSNLKHRCTARCVCPADGKPLLYWAKGDEHACLDADCRYGHGLETKVGEEIRDRAFERWEQRARVQGMLTGQRLDERPKLRLIQF